MSLKGKKEKLPKEEEVWIDAQGNIQLGKRPKDKPLPKIEDSSEIVYVIDGDWVSRSSGKVVDKESIEMKLDRFDSSLNAIEGRISAGKGLKDYHLKGYYETFRKIEQINDPRAAALKIRMSKVKILLERLK